MERRAMGSLSAFHGKRVGSSLGGFARVARETAKRAIKTLV
jgi:hypothetical protein